MLRGRDILMGDPLSILIPLTGQLKAEEVRFFFVNSQSTVRAWTAR